MREARDQPLTKKNRRKFYGCFYLAPYESIFTTFMNFLSAGPPGQGAASLLQSLRCGKVKNCKLCRFSGLCNDLPGVCIVIPYMTIAVVVIAVSYLFFTQEVFV